MSYRDDLEAAQARIANLEFELAEALAQRERHLVETLRSTELPTLNEHNRKTPMNPKWRDLGNASGVICPMCLLLFGDVVEMWIGGATRTVIYSVDESRMAPTDQTVRCPKCRYMGIRIPS